MIGTEGTEVSEGVDKSEGGEEDDSAEEIEGGEENEPVRAAELSEPANRSGPTVRYQAYGEIDGNSRWRYVRLSRQI